MFNIIQVEQKSESVVEIGKICIRINQVLFPNGSIVVDESVTNEFSYTFTCKPDFQLEGQPSVTCKSGQWDADIPTCKEIPSSSNWIIPATVGLSFLILILGLIYFAKRKKLLERLCNSRHDKERHTTPVVRYSAANTK